jgi:beta-lactamase regulating signal transducer with metallopeptidase domain
MLQYLLNASAIWLISLLLFDLFLRRESYHNYNRFYLLFTFLLGALFPLVQWQGNSKPLPATLQKSVDEVIIVKQNVIAATTHASTFDWQQWLFIIYIAGVAIAVVLLFIETIKLVALYRSGTRSKQDTWTIIETGKDHAPFSFMNALFICSRQQYTNDEWNMILIHERRHTTHLHFADLLLMQFARIAFWFHPLVYIYNKRLLLVHEYQADKASGKQLQVYGKFLVEQALLQAAPTISHSFNRSPIKKRILMLTHRSSAASKTKMLVFIPLALVCIICFSKNSFSQRLERKDNKAYWRGNTIELSIASTDTMTLVDPVTGKELQKIMLHDAKAISVNGKPIPSEVDIEDYPVFKGSDKNMREYLLKNMKTELSKLDDGYYRLEISDILIDEHGRIVYFDYKEMKKSNPDYNPRNGAASAPVMVSSGDPKITFSVDNKPGEVSGSADPIIIPGNTLSAALKSADNSTTAARGTPKPMTFTVVRNTDPNAYIPLSQSMQLEIYDKVCRLMETAPGFKPATLGGKNAVARFRDDVIFFNSFKIKDHKVYDFDPKTRDYQEL